MLSKCNHNNNFKNLKLLFLIYFDIFNYEYLMNKNI